jgi:hypothetical protein
MINVNKYTDVLDSGLLLDHYFLLLSMRDGLEIAKSRRIKGFMNLLTKKGYIIDGVLTDDALLLLEDQSITLSTTQQPVTEFANWVMSLYRKCQDKLTQLTGNKQVRGKIERKGYSFLPNSADLGKVLQKVIFLYKLKDLQAIEDCIISHIEKCHDAKHWFPVIGYYIMKNGKSDLVTDLENKDDGSEEKSNGKNLQKFI